MNELNATLLAHLEQSSRWAIALSGGMDSFVLLVQVARLAQTHSSRHFEILPVHVHHGLYEQADEWAQRCEALCETLGLKMVLKRVQVSLEGKGVEAAARKARYQAFAEVAREYSVTHFMTAHHLQDQAETLLFRLFRGTGVAGMQAMAEVMDYADYQLHRPLLSVNKQDIQLLADAYASELQWSYIQDPSNHDTQYARGVLRKHIVPVLNQNWPMWQENLLRFSETMKQEQGLLEELARMDYEQVSGVSSDEQGFSAALDITSLRNLSRDRQMNLLRFYLQKNGYKTPTKARLVEWVKQLNEVHQMGTDRALALSQEDVTLVLKDKLLRFSL